MCNIRVEYTSVGTLLRKAGGSLANCISGAWTNSIQPLWIAGKVMSHPSEHRAIVNILERIQRETGWQTSWRREDLETWWGDSDD